MEQIFRILGVPREVGLKLRKIGITGKFRSIRLFLLGPSFSELEFNMADPQASKHKTSPLSDKRLKYLTATLLIAVHGLASQTLVSCAKIPS